MTLFSDEMAYAFDNTEEAAAFAVRSIGIMMINAIFVTRDRNINAKIAESISINNSYKLLATIYSGLSLQTYYIVRQKCSFSRQKPANAHEIRLFSSL